MAQVTFKGGTPNMVPHMPSGAIANGDVVVRGTVPMIAHSDMENGRQGALSDGGGLYEMDCNASIGDGVALWWDDANNRVTTTATSNGHIGQSVGVSYAGNTKILVRHRPQGVTGVIV